MRLAPLALATVLAAGCATGTDPAGDSAGPEPTPASSPAEPAPSATESATAPAASAGPEEPPTKDTTTSKAKDKTKDKTGTRAPSGTRIVTAASQFGPVLFDGARQAVYLFDKERTARPECYGACAEAWPPVLTRGDPAARGGVRPGLLGTTERRDGTRQVTYNGHPLYYYAHEGPGQLLCHDVPGFGGLWLALTARGVRAE